jgi:hypothetical protein
MKGLTVTERLKYFPVKTFMLILLVVSTAVNYHLYNELKTEQNMKYWISGNEYKQIVTEIQRLEKSSLGVQ